MSIVLCYDWIDSIQNENDYPSAHIKEILITKPICIYYSLEFQFANVS